ncbi:MAG: helix-hairpin-helix domain-containing protein, partial [Cystobacterineae bacterium]|nr:helix-hairpin-helix domain-containing protein [Cystobacterineae bacterium]
MAVLWEVGVEWVGWVVAGSLLSALYEVPLGDIHSEEDLLVLAERGELSEESLESLLRLWQEGFSPETASRAEFGELPGLSQHEVEALLAHREAYGRLGGVEEWLAFGLVSEAQAQQLRPFVREASKLSGRVCLKTAGSWADERAPPALLSLRLESTLGFRLGATLNF